MGKTRRRSGKAASSVWKSVERSSKAQWPDAAPRPTPQSPPLLPWTSRTNAHVLSAIKESSPSRPLLAPHPSAAAVVPFAFVASSFAPGHPMMAVAVAKGACVCVRGERRKGYRAIDGYQDEHVAAAAVRTPPPPPPLPNPPPLFNLRNNVQTYVQRIDWSSRSETKTDQSVWWINQFRRSGAD